MYELRWSSSNVGVLVMVNSRPFWASCMMNWGSTAHPIPFPCTWQASPGRCWASPGTPRIHRGPLDWNMYNFVCWLHLKSILLYPNCLRFNSIWMDRVPTEVVVQRGWHTCSLKVLGIQAPASARKWLGSVQVLHLWSCKVCQLVSFYPVQIWAVVETFRSLYCSETWNGVLSTVPGVQWNCFPGKQNTFQTSPQISCLCAHRSWDHRAAWKVAKFNFGPGRPVRIKPSVPKLPNGRGHGGAHCRLIPFFSAQFRSWEDHRDVLDEPSSSMVKKIGFVRDKPFWVETYKVKSNDFVKVVGI
jgi:hypothetical protein